VTDVLLLKYSVKNVEGQMPILAGDYRTLSKLSKGIQSIEAIFRRTLWPIWSVECLKMLEKTNTG
jgi:hypothetical protein